MLRTRRIRELRTRRTNRKKLNSKKLLQYIANSFRVRVSHNALVMKGVRHSYLKKRKSKKAVSLVKVQLLNMYNCLYVPEISRRALNGNSCFMNSRNNVSAVISVRNVLGSDSVVNDIVPSPSFKIFTLADNASKRQRRITKKVVYKLKQFLYGNNYVHNIIPFRRKKQFISLFKRVFSSKYVSTFTLGQFRRLV